MLSPSPRLPPSPPSPLQKLQITTTVVPRTSSKSPVAITESNLRAFNVVRERKAQDMLKCLRRRTLHPGALEGLTRLHDFGKDGEEGRKLRRHSAPPELVLRDREGFATPKLDLPGAF
ncbi:hypothetical protein NM688_g4739 [Phlebia brevispora]|uniref:Uncharacterized protein n=1 Tax=Phlebia brevispora TaxID=194682 RepID=A0ACC1T1S7_9APHY|nr:hypothetical protein NM688_g4739 [Phlebia brevispora]